uniref:HMG-box protein Hmg3 n=1 Tax=Melanopsichium pennsylvanicum 4 TaxID=1398559 RepID=A0A077R0F4_9BASI|nr:HMG-box protein Hmg3 [Melanopsichium pennsylvanicum 4]
MPGSLADSSNVDSTPQKQANTDFGPDDRIGPLSGSGSGSGRKRASLDGARSRVSPYSPSRHRRTSSNGPLSPSVLNRQTRSSGQVLLRGPSQTAASLGSRAPVSRSVSYGSASQQCKVRTPARRSLDGHASNVVSTSFSTVVPDYLQNSSRVFLAPPPLPIGQAITTDATISVVEVSENPKSKCGVTEAIKRALPPERRAVLQANLAKRGLRPAEEIVSPSSYSLGAIESTSSPSLSFSDHSTPVFVQSNPWNSANSSTNDLSSQRAWTSRQTPWPATQEGHLGPSLDPAYHASLATFSQSDHDMSYKRMSSLADWSQPDPCWLASSQSQPITIPHSSPLPLEDQTCTNFCCTTTQCEPNHQQQPYPVPPPLFSSFELAQYAPLPYDVNSTNSAIVALSNPNEHGQVQGQFYSLDGQLIGQGTVDNPDGSHAPEEERQKRALEDLLTQLVNPNMEKDPQPANPFQRPLFDYSAAQCLHSTPQQQHLKKVSGKEETQWDGWPEELPHAPVTRDEPSTSQLVYRGLALDPTMYGSLSENNAAYQLTTASQLTGQEEIASRAGARFLFSAASSNPDERNFSRPVANDGETNDEGHKPGRPVNQMKRTENSLTLDAMLLTASQEQQQQRGSKFGNWKANHMNTFKKAVARVKHKATPSTSSIVDDDAENHADETS